MPLALTSANLRDRFCPDRRRSWRHHFLVGLPGIALLGYVLMFMTDADAMALSALTVIAILLALVSVWPRAIGALMALLTFPLYFADPTRGLLGFLMAVPVVVIVARGKARWGLALAALSAIVASASHNPTTEVALILMRALGEFLVMYLLPIGLGLLIHYWRRRQEAAVAALRERQRHERRYIAADLHDTVARDLTHAILTLEQTLDTADGAIHEQISSALESNRLALDGLRYTMRFMRDDIGAPERMSKIPLSDTIEQWTAQLKEAGFQVHQHLEGDLHHLSTGAREMTRRVFSEGCVNILRHGEPGACEIFLEVKADQVQLAMSNTVSGRTFRLSNRVGLAGLRDVIETAGGTLTGSRLGSRWLLSATIPVDPRAYEMEATIHA